MAVSHRAVFVQTPKITSVAFVNADAANTKKTIHTAGVNGAKVLNISASSTDTANRIGQLWLTRAATSYLLASAIVATLAGTEGVTPSQNLIPTSLLTLPVDNDGQPYLFMESGDTLQVSFTAQVTAAKEIDVTCIAGNF